MTHDESPDEFRPDAGVRRLNRRPLAIILVTICAVVAALMYGLATKKRQMQVRAKRVAEKHVVQTARPAPSLVSEAPKSGPVPERPKPAPRFSGGPSGGLIVAANESPSPLRTELPDRSGESETRRRQMEKRRSMHETALTAMTRVATLDHLSAPNSEPPSRSAKADVRGTSRSAADSMSPALRSGLAAMAGGGDVNKQDEKNKFAEQERLVGYLPATRHAPLSDYELKAGTVIPAVLISGVNSDLPGPILAQVTQNVYDTASGKSVLIPQGAKLLGLYDSRISVGQSRVQIAWTRVNFPDASTLELGNMPGLDQAGYAGFNDKVNAHVFRVFRDAMMLSFISAGTQLSQPRSRSAEGRISAEEQIAAAMGQQFGAAGMELAKRNSQIQPTIEIRPGYRFVVMVTKDVILPPYEGK